MIYIGIDVAKNKHDCFITNSDGEILFKPFTIPNNLEGFDDLYHKIESTTNDPSQVKVGLEATGHYTITIFLDISLIKVCPPMLSIRYILICTEKV